jgi:hypothetical protein
MALTMSSLKRTSTRNGKPKLGFSFLFDVAIGTLRVFYDKQQQQQVWQLGKRFIFQLNEIYSI